MKEMEEAVEEASSSGDRPRGRLRLNLPRLAAEMILVPRLAQFTQLYAEIALDLVVEDNDTDIVATGFDAGIRPGERVQGDMIAVRLTADLRPAVFASPGYLASMPVPVTPSDLSAHRCINYRWTRNGTNYRWQFARAAENQEVAVGALHTINDTGLIMAAALGEAGIGYLLEDAVADHLAAGRLVRLLDDWCQPVPGFHLYYSGRRHVSAALKALIGFLRYEPLPALSRHTGAGA